MAASLKGIRVLVLGASSQVGYFLLPRLLACGAHVQAVSRSGTPEFLQSLTAVNWLHPEALPEVLPGTTHLVSAGPLELVPDWVASMYEPELVAAVSSSSVLSKRDSSVPQERALMRAMAAAEQRLLAQSQSRAFSLCVLQPTLIYGCGLDANLSVLARFIQRFGFLPIARKARGKRQPLHAEDLAQALLQVLLRPPEEALISPLAGGEILSYRTMAERLFLALKRRPRLMPLPASVLARAADTAARFGRAPVGSGAMIYRQREDLIFDDLPARSFLQLQPRAFDPQAADFEPPKAVHSVSS